MCAAGFPADCIPSWQDAQLCVTLLWSKRAICQCRVVWQVSHAAGVRMWRAGLPLARTELWQSAQTLGVPVKLPS